jgi:haloalkane dehalogenase
VFPYESDQLMVGGHSLRFVDVGSGEGTLLCVHGNPTWSFYWRRVIERFSPTHRVVAVDHLGCGRSDKPDRGQFDYSLAAHGANLQSLIDHLDLRQITLLAHDWGGAIGLFSVLDRLDRLDRIILLNTGAFPPPFVPWRIAACRIPVLGPLATRGLNLFARAATRMAMSRQDLSEDAARGLLAPYDSWANRVAIDAFVRDIPMSRRHPTYRTLQEIESRLPQLAGYPSLLIWGMQDWCFRPECLRRFQSMWPAAESVEIGDAGHYVMEDAPQETLAAIGSFLKNSAVSNAEASSDSAAREQPASASTPAVSQLGSG